MLLLPFLSQHMPSRHCPCYYCFTSSFSCSSYHSSLNICLLGITLFSSRSTSSFSCYSYHSILNTTSIPGSHCLLSLFLLLILILLPLSHESLVYAQWASELSILPHSCLPCPSAASYMQCARHNLKTLNTTSYNTHPLSLILNIIYFPHQIHIRSLS